MPKEWIILAVVAGALGFWRSKRPSQERFTAVLLPALLVTLVFVYAETALLNTRWTWSACRLAPVIGMFHGYPLYSPIETGPINGWLYGPVAAIAWTPAALAGSPFTALLIAALINLLFLLGPLAGAGALAAPGRRAGGLVAFAAGAAALLQIYPTWYMASALNADAIAVGLGAGSCLLLQRGNPSTRASLILAAALSALAVWTKQTEVLLVVAQLGWLIFSRGWRATLTFALGYAGAILLVAAGLGLTQNSSDVLFNMWTVPSSHALLGGWSAAWAELKDLIGYTPLLWVPVLAVAGWRWRTQSSAPPPGDHAAFSPALFLLAALFLLPTGIMATIKVGGDRNSLHSVYYLVAAFIVTLAQRWPARQRGLQPAVLLVTATSLTFLAVRQVAGYPHLSMLPPRCLSQEAWTYAREHPQGGYFPWDPLATVMAEGRMYHFEYGVLDRIYAGLPPTPERLRRNLPAHMDAVIYPRADFPRTMVKEYLPEFNFASATDDWLIYRQIVPLPPLPSHRP